MFPCCAKSSFKSYIFTFHCAPFLAPKGAQRPCWTLVVKNITVIVSVVVIVVAVIVVSVVVIAAASVVVADSVAAVVVVIVFTNSVAVVVICLSLFRFSRGVFDRFAQS